ncbi:MAG TPA: sigma-70 family RNA polymerase sigma factor [Acidimicrobiales bacterium]|nr:sigma-70 family RNA polymerase sigma factor [Acidimicrobiales bacterium]
MPGTQPRSWRRRRLKQADGVSDEALLTAMAAGDGSAAAALVRRHQARVYGIAYAITDDRSAAEDIAQEAFLRVWRHAAVFDAHRARAQTWISSIARNLAIDFIRARRASPVDPHDALQRGELPSAEPSSDTRLVESDLVQRVRRVVDQLPTEQRRALLRAAFSGQTAAEVAVAEDIPLGTAKSRIRLALAKVRDTLAEEEAFDEPDA